MRLHKQVEAMLEILQKAFEVPCDCDQMHDPQCLVTSSAILAQVEILQWVLGNRQTWKIEKRLIRRNDYESDTRKDQV